MIRLLSALALLCASAVGQPTYFGNIYTGTVRPRVGSTYSLGSTGTRWTNTFFDRVTLTTGAGFGFTSSIHPSADASFDIGSIASGNYRFKDLFLSGALNAYSLDLNSGTAITGAVRPSTGSTYSLGTTGSRWTNFFTDRITLSDSAGLGFTSNLYPSADATYNFGTTGYRWATANISGTVTTGNIVSQTGSTHSLGTTGNRWTNAFFDRITMSTGAGQGFTTTIKPSAAYSFDLGDSTDRWNGLYGRFISLRTTGTSYASQQISDSSGTPLFIMSDTGIGAGDFRVYDGGFAKFEVYSGQTNINTTNLSITGTTTHTGAILFSANNTYNIGSTTNNANNGYFNRLFVNNTQGITTTVGVPCGTLTFTGGLLTSKGTCP